MLKLYCICNFVLIDVSAELKVARERIQELEAIIISQKSEVSVFLNFMIKVNRSRKGNFGERGGELTLLNLTRLYLSITILIVKHISQRILQPFQ